MVPNISPYSCSMRRSPSRTVPHRAMPGLLAAIATVLASAAVAMARIRPEATRRPDGAGPSRVPDGTPIVIADYSGSYGGTYDYADVCHVAIPSAVAAILEWTYGKLRRLRRLLAITPAERFGGNKRLSAVPAWTVTNQLSIRIGSIPRGPSVSSPSSERLRAAA